MKRICNERVYHARPKGEGVRLHPPFGSENLFFLYFIFFFLHVIEVDDVRRYPYPVFGKLTQKF